MRRALAVALWVATLLLAFGVGRGTSPPDEPSPGDLSRSLRAALAEGDPIERIGRASRLLEQLDPESLPEVVALYDDMLPVMAPWEVRSLMRAWARFDPAGALEHGLGWPPKGNRELAAGAALEEWARLDSAEARDGFEQIAAREPRLAGDLARGLVSGWVHSGDATQLGAFLADMRPGVRDEAMDVALRALIRRGGPDAVLGFVDAIVRDDAHAKRFKRTLFRLAAHRVARGQPEHAAAWSLEHAEDAYAVDAPGIIAQEWGAKDGAAALLWLSKHPADDLGKAAVGETFVRWAGVDPKGAEAWLESELLTAFHDPALEAWAGRRLAREPREALTWCERITDAERQQGCLLSNTRSWYARDAVAAEVWLQQSSLDEEMRREARIPPRLQTRPRRGAR